MAIARRGYQQSSSATFIAGRLASDAARGEFRITQRSIGACPLEDKEGVLAMSREKPRPGEAPPAAPQRSVARPDRGRGRQGAAASRRTHDARGKFTKANGLGGRPPGSKDRRPRAGTLRAAWEKDFYYPHLLNLPNLLDKLMLRSKFKLVVVAR